MIRATWRAMAVAVAAATLLAVGGGLLAAGDAGAGAGAVWNPKVWQAQQQEKTQAFLAQEEADGKAFMASLAGKPKAEKLAAIRRFKTGQYERNCDFRDEMIQERRRGIVAAQASRAPGGGSGAGGGAWLLKRMEANYEEMKAFFAGKHAENLAFLDKVAADASLDGPALDQALTAFFQAQK